MTATSLFSQQEGLYKEIDKIIRFDTEIPYSDHDGYIIGIIDNDSTYILNFGINEIDTFDIFELGGVSKVFTADLALRLSELELLDLTMNINDYFPDLYKNESLSGYSIEDLLMHKIQFPKRPSDLSQKEFDISNPYAYYTKDDLLRFYANFKEPKRSFWDRTLVSYSHINYALLEIIIESTLNMPFEDALQTYLLQDLGLKNTSSTTNLDSICKGFDRSRKIPDPWLFQSFAGSEGIKSDLFDLLHFMRLNMNIAETKIDSTLSLSLEMQEKSKISNTLAHTYAWYVLKSRKTGSIVTHSGSTERHKVYMHFRPQTKTGVVILSMSSSGTGELGMLVLRLINNSWKRK